MEIHRSVVVLDADNVSEVSEFWARLLGGKVIKDEDDHWHSIIDGNDKWVLAVQYAPDHVRPNWPNGEKQQVHLDFHVKDFQESHEKVMALGAKVLRQPPDIHATEGFQVYEDPAGHPFCLCWGQPTDDQLKTFLKKL